MNNLEKSPYLYENLEALRSEKFQRPFQFSITISMKRFSPNSPAMRSAIDDFQYYLTESEPAIDCDIDFAFDDDLGHYYCLFDLLDKNYKCPYSARTKNEAYQIACLHYLYTLYQPIAQLQCSFERFYDSSLINNDRICTFQEYKQRVQRSDTITNYQALNQLVSELRDSNLEFISFSIDTQRNFVKITSRDGQKTFNGNKFTFNYSNEDKKEALAQLAGDYLLQYNSRFF